MSADPYVDAKRQQAVFGSSLSRMGILPVQLLLENSATRRVLARASEVALVLPDGRAFLLAGAFAAVAWLEGAPVQYQPMAQGAAVHTAPLAGAYFGPAAYGAVSMVGAMFAVANMVELNRRAELQREILADYRSKELRDVAFDPGESRHSFVYFVLPPDAPRTGDFALAVRLIDAEDATVTVVQVPLPGLVVE